MTQFVSLCREEVIRIEEYKKSLQSGNTESPVVSFITEVEKEEVVV